LDYFYFFCRILHIKQKRNSFKNCFRGADGHIIVFSMFLYDFLLLFFYMFFVLFHIKLSFKFIQDILKIICIALLFKYFALITKLQINLYKN